MKNRKTIEDIRQDFRDEMEIMTALSGDKELYKKWRKEQKSIKVLKPISLNDSDKQ